jgi:hypothetical protein
MVQWGSWVVLHPLSRREQTDVWEASIVRKTKVFYTQTTHTHADERTKKNMRAHAHAHSDKLTRDTHTRMQNVPPGRHAFKYLVDGEWKLSTDYQVFSAPP